MRFPQSVSQTPNLSQRTFGTKIESTFMNQHVSLCQSLSAVHRVFCESNRTAISDAVQPGNDGQSAGSLWVYTCGFRRALKESYVLTGIPPKDKLGLGNPTENPYVINHLVRRQTNGINLSFYRASLDYS